MKTRPYSITENKENNDSNVEKETRPKTLREEQDTFTERSRGVKALTCDLEATDVLEFEECRERRETFLLKNPFPDQTPLQMLTRQYLVLDTTWTNSSPTQVLSFPYHLLVHPQIANTLKTFRYMVADVKVVVKINATPFHQGAVMFFHIPAAGPGEVGSTPMYGSGWEHTVVDISTSPTYETTMKYISPFNFFTINPTVQDDASICRFFIVPLVQLSAATSDVPLSVNLQVYANFENPKVAGFIVQQSSTQKKFVGSSVQKLDVPESDSDPAELVVKATGTMLSNVVTKFVEPIVKSIETPVQSVLEVARNGAASFFDKPLALIQAMPMIPKFSRADSYGAGSCLADRLSLYPKSSLANSPFFCYSTYDSFSRIAQVPMLHHRYDFISTNLSCYIGVRPMWRGFFNTAADEPDYLAHQASLAKYWRGSIKYYVRLVTNQFVKARMRVSYVMNSSQPTPITGGDFPSMIIDIQGPTEFDITVPYLWITHWRLTEESPGQYTAPSLVFQLFKAPVTTGAQDARITMLVWRAGGENIQFAFAGDQNYEEPPTIQQEASIRARFNQPFKPITCDCNNMAELGLVQSEQIGTIIDLMRRYYTTDQILETPYLAGDLTPLCCEARLFRYWRGSMRTKLIFAREKDPPNPDLPYPSFAWATMSNNWSCGGTVTQPSVSPLLEWETPWFSIFPYMPLITSQSPYTIVASDRETFTVNLNAEPVLQWHMCSVGEDFQAGYLRPPNHYPVVPPSKKSTTT